MNIFYRFIIGLTNQISKFLAFNKYIKIKIKEKSLVFNWLLIEIMLLVIIITFIYSIGNFGLAIDILLGFLTLVTILLAGGFIGLLIRDSHPEKKLKFKSIEHYLKKQNITIESKKNEKYNPSKEKSLSKSTIFKNSKLDLIIIKALDDNNILNKKNKKWNGLGKNYGSTGSQIFTLIIVLKENSFLLSGVSNKTIIDYFQARITNISLPTEQHISQVREKIFTDNELNSDLKYHDTYIRFHELICAKA